jgi:hypothetical protein
MCIPFNSETSDIVIQKSWKAVIEKVENGHLLSSEKTLCFLFAMEVFKQCGDNIELDFENQCYGDQEGNSKYLDLLIQSEDYRVAIEFKLPNKSEKSNSNQTERRKAIYIDLNRLLHLRCYSIKADACYFLMATNDNAYVNIQKVSKHSECLTGHGYKFEFDNSDNHLKGIACEFKWIGITQDNKKQRITGKYAWLTPIKI